MRNLNSSLTSRRPSASAKVADLDVTPVMNMFIILIPFLISMSAFTHLASHSFDLPGNEGAGHASERNELPMTVVLGQRQALVVQGDVELAHLMLPEMENPFAELVAFLQAEAPERVVVAVDGSVLTDQVVACLDACKAAGCEDVGLADGTGALPWARSITCRRKRTDTVCFQQSPCPVSKRSVCAEG